MARLLSQRKSSAAAYKLVDLSDLESDLRKDIIEDAHAGGGVYGVRVVEESVNGPARAPIYGVYNDGPDADRWAAAKKELDLDADEVDDGTVRGTAMGIEADPRREATLREAAAQTAEAEADRIRAGEAAEVRAITGDGDDDEPVTRTVRVPSLDHTANIMDTTLDPEATNEAADAENQEPEKAPKPKTKTPK